MSKARDLADLLADGVVGSGEVADGSITEAKLASGAVTNAKIANGAVNANKLASGAAVPSQSGHSGKFLTTNGSSTNWATVNTDVSGDTSPQLGGNLDGNSYTIDLSSNDSHIRVPVGTTAQRPSSPTNGMMRYNSTTGYFETYTASGWGAISTPPSIAGVSPDPADGTSGETITITGNFFDTNTNVTLTPNGGSDIVYIAGSSVTFVSSTELRISLTQNFSLSSSPATISVTNGAGLTATAQNILTLGTAPTWNTAAGSLGTFTGNASVNTSVSASDAQTGVTYSVKSGSSLPSGLSLNSSTGAITGTAPFKVGTDSFTLVATDGVGNETERTFSMSFTATPSGGSISDSGGYRYHTFTSSSTLSVPTGYSVSCDYLCIAGGGGGGADSYSNRAAGGGGAGGYLSGSSTLNSTATITVGGGGAGGIAPNNSGNPNGYNGGNSTITGPFSITSYGGGGGGGHNTSGNYNGNNGGSGGGGSNGSSSNHGSGTAGQGHDGKGSNQGGGGNGLAWHDGVTRAGGGGGAGSESWYPGGGGGASPTYQSSVYTGGTGGGGNGGYSSGVVTGQAGATNKGSGGGASRETTGGTGGSGIIIIRYQI